MLADPRRSIYQKLTEHEHQGHSKRLKEMKPFMKITTPPDFQHLRRRQNGQARSSQIVNDNIKIMTKIQELMQSKSEVVLNGFRHASLNRDSRNKEQRRIDRENLRLMKRLGETSTVYPLKQFIIERKDNERYIKTRCVHPYSPVLKSSKAELIYSCSRELGESTYLFEVFRKST
jgi:hypothetical protein